MADNGTQNERIILSEVPGEQPKRESIDKENTEDNFVPVLTVTKKETVLTKGDVKLQKVTVTENVSAVPSVPNPLYSEIYADVISGPHPTRKLRKGSADRRKNNEINDPNTKVVSDKGTPSKLPQPTFRSTVEKVKDARRRSSGTDRRNIQVLQNQKEPRRSSIPKLKKSEVKLMTKKQITLSPDTQAVYKTNSENRQKPDEEEFDKLFKEIINDNDNTAGETLPLDSSVDDEKLLNSFEDIINAYELEPVLIENKKDIRPKEAKLKRHKSHESHKLPRDDRRNSLKSLSSVSQNRDPFQNKDFAEKPLKPFENPLRPLEKPLKLQSDQTTMQSEIQSPNLENTGDVFINEDTAIESVTENSNEKIINKPNCEDKHLLDETKEESIDGDIILAIEEKIKLFEVNKDYVATPPVDDNKSRKSSIEDDTPSLKGKVSRIISQIDSKSDSDEKITMNDNSQTNGLPKKKSILSKIAIFERKDSSHNVTSNDQPKVRTPTKMRSFTKNKFLVEEVLNCQIRRASGDDGNPQKKSKKQLTTLYSEKVQDDLEDDSVNFDQATIDTVNESNAEHADRIIGEFDTDRVNQKESTNVELKPVGSDAIFETKHKDKVEKELENIEKLHTQHGDWNKKRHNEKSEEKTVEIRLRRFEKQSDNGNELLLNRSKSLIDSELGQSVKGKVQNIIDSIKSEKVNQSSQKPINIKERPRTKSVSEKIALFERRMTSAAVEEPKVINSPIRTYENHSQPDNIPKDEVDSKYEEMLTELRNAKHKYGVTSEVPSLELNNGAKMPTLALGTASAWALIVDFKEPIDGSFNEDVAKPWSTQSQLVMDPKLVRQVVCSAIELGYRAVDTAYIHGNERSVGEAIAEKIRDGTVKRDELFITSKLWSTFHHPQLVEKACRESLQAMGLEYFDLYLINNPMSFKEGSDPVPTIANVVQYSEYEYMDAWFAMEKLMKKGLIRSIGLCNFNSHQIAKIYDKGTIKPVVDQVECHPYLNQDRLREYCNSHGIVLCCYGALGSKGTRGTYKNPGMDAVIDDPLIQDMAAALNISAARLLVSYQLERGHAVVVEATSGAQLWDNLQALKFKLLPTHLDSINSLNRNKRYFSFKGMGDTHKHYPFKIPF